MKIKVRAVSCAYDCDYGGEQTIEAEPGEYILDEIFRLHFFRVIVDEVIEGAVCFRLMEGSEAHYFVLEEGEEAAFERQTGMGDDSFYFTLTKE